MRFFTINLHLTAKLDGSSTQGDARPPVNGGVDQRIAQVETIAVSFSDHSCFIDVAIDVRGGRAFDVRLRPHCREVKWV